MEVHPQFKLNTVPLNKEGLYEVAHSWVREGKGFEVTAGDFILDWLSPSNTIRVNTSGSTGTPKTIALKKEFMVNSALATGHFFQLSPKDSALLCLPSEYIAGKMMLVRAMVLGLHLDVVAPSYSPMELVENTYTFSAMVPLQAKNSLAKLHQINKLIIGGAPISNAQRETLSKQPNAIFETYGMTETITHIAAKRISGPNTGGLQTFFETLPEIEIEMDKRGCLVINAPKISNTKIITNDLVEILGNNRFNWLGRYDNIINSGGIKLMPEQIEKKLSGLIPNRFFVAGIADEALGQKLILVVEENVDSEKLLEKIRCVGSLDKFETPKAIIIVERFAETPSGKVDRRKTLSLAT